MNALITGGAGFIGSRLAEELIGRGDTVCVVDNISTGNSENIQHLQENERFSFVAGSVLDEQLMARVVEESDVIYHLAAAVGVHYIMEHPLKSIEINVHGTENVLKLASKHKQKVMIASSSEVYGKDGNIPYKENGNRLMYNTPQKLDSMLRWIFTCHL